jgi:hypothetical protein
MNTLHFNDADLKANREGRLSDAQIKRFEAEVDRLQLQRRYSLWAGVTVFSLAFIVMIMVTAGAIGVMTVVATSADSGLNRSDVFPLVTLLTGVMLVIFWIAVFIFIVILVKYALRIRSLTSAPVRAVEGKADVIYTYSTNHDGEDRPINQLLLYSSRYLWHTFTFDEPESLYMFETGKLYRVYYLPYAEPQALSAEEIEPEKTKH